MMTLPTKSPTLPRLTSLVTVGVCSTVLLTVMAMLLLVDHFAVDYAAREAAQRLQQLSWQVRDANSPAEIRQLLENLQKTFPDYAWIGLAYPDGSIYAGTQGLLEGVDVSARPWFKGGQQQLYAGDYHPATLLGKQLPPSADPWRFVDVAAPVHRSNGSYRGVLCVHMSWGWARRLAKTMLAPATQQYAAEFIVVRGDGTVMLGPPGMEEQKIALASLTRAQAGQPGALTERWPDGRNYLTGYSQTGSSGDPTSLKWSILVRQPEAVAMAGARALERQILLLGAVLGLALALAAALLADRKSEE